MPDPVSRRSVLLAGVGAAVTAACGSGGGSKASKVTLPSPSGSSGTNAAGGLQAAVGTVQPLSGVDQRIALGLFGSNGDLVRGATVDVAFGSDPSHFGPGVRATYHDDGIPTRAYYVVETRFDHAGEWFMRARVGGQDATAPLLVVDSAKSRVPIPGKPLIRFATPTVQDHRGVEPICTRQPPCPFHQVSLDAAMDQHVPMAVLFATPKFCASRTCGPVLDVLISVAGGYPKVTFIHQEIWATDQGPAGKSAPAVDAYGLEGEPFLFLAAPDGTVRERLDGPFDRVEARQALDRLAALS